MQRIDQVHTNDNHEHKYEYAVTEEGEQIEQCTVGLCTVVRIVGPMLGMEHDEWGSHVID